MGTFVFFLLIFIVATLSAMLGAFVGANIAVARLLKQMSEMLVASYLRQAWGEDGPQ